MNDIEKKIHQLFLKIQTDFIVIPSWDEFSSEYVNDEVNRLKKISNFTGSNGVAVISKTERYLLTDGRYFLQAQKQSPNLEIIDIKKNNLTSFIATLVERKMTVCLFSELTSSKSATDYLTLFSNFIKFANLSVFDKIFDIKQKISNPLNYEELSTKVTGESSKSKINRLILNSPNADVIFISDSSSSSWLLNTRSNDVKNCGICNFYAIIFTKTKTVFSLTNLYDYQTLKNYIEKTTNICTDLSCLNYSLYLFFKSYGIKIIDHKNPVILMKAIKNETEIKGFKEAHLQDALNVNNFLDWFKVYSKKNSYTEYEISNILTDFRKESDMFIKNSFDPIVGFKENGAIIHYKPIKNDCLKIKDSGVLLIDSGGHYSCGGTTDVTRTIWVGSARPPKQIKTHFTLVLKGMIAISKLHFPVGTTGGQIDAIARQFLWNYNLDYQHGTGHGVGSYLSVHEGPHSISTKSNQPLQEGMIVSNEPGIYIENEYGIRIENLMLVVKSSVKDFLHFKTLTLIEIDNKLIEKSLLTKEEAQWLKSYHNDVKNAVKVMEKKYKKSVAK